MSREFRASRIHLLCAGDWLSHFLCSPVCYQYTGAAMVRLSCLQQSWQWQYVCVCVCCLCLAWESTHTHTHTTLLLIHPTRVLSVSPHANWQMVMLWTITLHTNTHTHRKLWTTNQPKAFIDGTKNRKKYHVSCVQTPTTIYVVKTQLSK